MITVLLSFHIVKKKEVKSEPLLTFSAAWPAVTRLQLVWSSACHLTADSQSSTFVYTIFTPLTEGTSLAPDDMKGSDPQLVPHGVLHKGQGSCIKDLCIKFFALLQNFIYVHYGMQLCSEW